MDLLGLNMLSGAVREGLLQVEVGIQSLVLLCANTVDCWHDDCHEFLSHAAVPSNPWQRIHTQIQQMMRIASGPWLVCLASVFVVHDWCSTCWSGPALLPSVVPANCTLLCNLSLGPL